jgi:hypothetical protein
MSVKSSMIGLLSNQFLCAQNDPGQPKSRAETRLVAVQTHVCFASSTLFTVLTSEQT